MIVLVDCATRFAAFAYMLAASQYIHGFGLYISLVLFMLSLIWLIVSL